MNTRTDRLKASGLTAWPIVYYKPGCPFGVWLTNPTWRAVADAVGRTDETVT